MSYNWCRYNHHFRSEKHGDILFNAMTNKIALIQPEFMEKMNILRKNPGKAEELLDGDVLNILKEMKVLVDDNEEEFHFLRRRHRRFNSRYGVRHSLGLTIVPTLACNFNCAYCFEGEKANRNMSDETADKLLSFVKDYPGIKCLSVNWFGGEPLLQFERMCALTEQFKKLFPGKGAYSATMISNAFLLTPEKAEKLNDLNIKGIQVTLDGLEKDHDQRRKLKSGKGTFSTIIENMDNLLKVWNGELSIRCNIYPEEINRLKELNGYLKERFAGCEDIPQAYPGFIHDYNDKHLDTHCSDPTSDDIANMLLSVGQENAALHIQMLYPDCKVKTCTATSKNSYVIGPLGEIYKCWDDLGEENRCMGSLFDEKQDWNEKKLSIQYMLGCDSFDDPECRKCFFVHICDGSCVKIRHMRKYEDKELPPPCTPMKGYINEILDYICDNIMLSRELKSMLFSPEAASDIKTPVKCLN